MVTVLTILALLAGVVGFVLLTQATTGVGIIALGCLAGILARVIQAGEHKDQSLQFIQKELEYLAGEYLAERKPDAEPVRPAHR